jgi:hypothetical protein
MWPTLYESEKPHSDKTECGPFRPKQWTLQVFFDILAPNKDRFAFLFGVTNSYFLARNLSITWLKMLKTLRWC